MPGPGTRGAGRDGRYRLLDSLPPEGPSCVLPGSEKTVLSLPRAGVGASQQLQAQPRGGGRTSDPQEAVEGALGPTERRAGMPSARPCPAILCPPRPGGSTGAPTAKGLPLDQRLPADGLGTWFTHTQPLPAEQPSFGHPRGLGPLTQSSQSSSKLCSLSPRGQHTVPGEECSQGVSPRLPALSEVEDSQSVLMEAVRPRLGPGRPRALQKACKKSGSCLPPGQGRQGTEGDQASLGNLSKPIAQPLRGQPHPQETG